MTQVARASRLASQRAAAATPTSVQTTAVNSVCSAIIQRSAGMSRPGTKNAQVLSTLPRCTTLFVQSPGKATISPRPRVLLRDHQVHPGGVVVDRGGGHRAEIEQTERQKTEEADDQRQPLQSEGRREAAFLLRARAEPGPAGRGCAGDQEESWPGDREHRPEQMQEPAHVHSQDEDGDTDGKRDRQRVEAAARAGRDPA